MNEIYAIQIPEYLDPWIYEEFLKYVDPVKQERIRHFFRIEDSYRSLFADLLVRFIIMTRTGLSNREIEFGSNNYGKPYLLGCNDLHFNISHSGIWSVATVDSSPVGIDIERITDIDFSISREFFSEDEHKDLMHQNNKVDYFFTLWSLKESYLKHIGKGLTEPLNSFSLKFSDSDKIQLLNARGKTIDGISFAQYSIHRDYKLTLCASHDNLPKHVSIQPLDGLLNRFVA